MTESIARNPAGTDRERRAGVPEGLWQVLDNGLRIVLDVPVALLTAGLLGPGLLGVYKAVQNIANIGGNCDLGLSRVYQRELPILRASGNSAQVHELRSTTFTGSFLATSVLILCLGAVYMGGWTLGGTFSDPISLLLTATLLLVNRLWTLVDAHLSAEGDFVRQAKIRIVLSVANPCIAIPLVLVFGVHGAIASMAITSLCYVLLVIVPTPLRVSFKIDLKRLYRNVGIGISMLGMSFGNSGFWTVEMFLVPLMLSIHDAGIYGFAVGSIRVANSVPRALHNMLLRNVALERGRRGVHDKSYLRKYLVEHMASYIFLTAVCLGAIYLCYRTIVFTFLNDYVGSLPVMLTLIVGTIVLQMKVFCGLVLNITDQFQTLLATQLGTIALNIVLDIVFIGQFGLKGAALGACLSFIITGLVFTLIAARAVSSTPVSTTLRMFLKTCVAAAFCGCFLYFAPDLLFAFRGFLTTSGFSDELAAAAELVVLLPVYALVTLAVFAGIFRREDLLSEVRPIAAVIVNLILRAGGKKQ